MFGILCSEHACCQDKTDQAMPSSDDNSTRTIDFTALSKPWEAERESIYTFIKRHISEETGKLSVDGDSLPDENRIYKDGGIRWVAGGLDGAFGHHGGAGQAEESAKKLLQALQKFLDSPDSDGLAAFYTLLISEGTLNLIDPFLEEVAEAGLIEDPSLYAVAKWLLKNAPDREAIKSSIAILGVCATNDDTELFIEIGKHEEFTLYASVALLHSTDSPEEPLFELAKAVDGWGRIHCIERLQGTENVEIKNWMLRSGYKNSIMYEYTAHPCAVAGDLLAALAVNEPEDEIIDGACEILASMSEPGPGLEDYEDGPQATLSLLDHLDRRPISLSQLACVNAIKAFVLEIPTGHESEAAWNAVRERVLTTCERIRTRPDWTERIKQGLLSDVDHEFWAAARAADVIGLDTWEFYFERVQQGKDGWYYLMQTQEETRVERAVSLAEELLPLDEIASGVDDQLGLGPEYRWHSALDYVLQDLRHWPGQGMKLVRAGLNSPVTRNRNLALKALQHWGKEKWDESTQNQLESLLEIEPNEMTRVLISDVLSGKVDDDEEEYVEFEEGE